MGAQGNFIDQQLLQTMIGKVWTPTTEQPASEQLAQVVCHAITQDAAELSAKANRELALALSEKLKHMNPECAVDACSKSDLVTAHYLHESLERLTFMEPLQAEQV